MANTDRLCTLYLSPVCSSWDCLSVHTVPLTCVQQLGLSLCAHCTAHLCAAAGIVSLCTLYLSPVCSSWDCLSVHTVPLTCVQQLGLSLCAHCTAHLCAAAGIVSLCTCGDCPIVLNCYISYVHMCSRRPNDSRMLVALGDCYSILGRIQEAKKVCTYAIIHRPSFFCVWGGCGMRSQNKKGANPHIHVCKHIILAHNFKGIPLPVNEALASGPYFVVFVFVV